VILSQPAFVISERELSALLDLTVEPEMVDLLLEAASVIRDIKKYSSVNSPSTAPQHRSHGQKQAKKCHHSRRDSLEHMMSLTEVEVCVFSHFFLVNEFIELYRASSAFVSGHCLQPVPIKRDGEQA
jgi:hypothetical protein